MENVRKTPMTILTVVVLGLLVAGASTGDATAEPEGLARAVFAGGCFWCMEKPFEVLDGVISVESGYAGGHVEDPTYKQVSAGGTGHAEVVEVVYDPEKVSYEILLYVYWRNVDPLDGEGQFCDRGASYRPAIFYVTEQQRELAVQSRKKVAKILGKNVEVQIEPLERFYVAEDYHQDYYKENKIRYWYYRKRCGRDARLADVWGEEAGGENPHPWLQGGS
jgi:peptide-methionine (S)-S-oxide reductase